MSFVGFSPETVAFLEELSQNNDKDWFAAHKELYERVVLEPARAFVVAMGARLREIAPEIQADPRVNRSLFRVYRDTRFSQNKAPLKTNLAIWMWEGEGKRMECPGFYFHLEPGEFFLGSGIYMFPDKELLHHWREAVDDDEFGESLEAAAAEVEAAGLQIGGAGLKRVPRGYDKEHPRGRWLKHKGLTVGTGSLERPPELYSEALVDWCMERFVLMEPVHAWLREWRRHL